MDLKKSKHIIGIILLSVGLLFNLVLYYPETKITLDPNDNVFQYALVNRTNTIWGKFGCPLSPSCIPHLIDHWVPNWAEGYPLPYYYSHLPQIAIVSTYNLFIGPLSSLFHSQFSLFNYYSWTKYLLLTLFPLPIFLALRVVGINPLFAALAAILASHFSTDGLYGIDPPSYLWRGYGLTSQLYSIFFIPLAISYTYRALSEILPGRKVDKEQLKEKSRTKIEKLTYFLNTHTVFLATAFTTLSIAGHLGIGVILLLTLPVFLLIDFKPSHIKMRLVPFLKITLIPILLLSYWIVPAMLHNTYHLISVWDPVWKFNSWGLIEVIRQFFQGEIFDWKRFPVLTIVITIGLFVILISEKYRTFGFAFLLWILMYCGRATWGGLIDLIPSMKDFHQSRFVVGVHLASIFLLPFGLVYLTDKANSLLGFIKTQLDDQTRDGLKICLSGITIGLIFYLTLAQSIPYATLNNRWIGESNAAYEYSRNDFTALMQKLNELPPARVYAGRPGNWGREFRYSSTQMYMAISITGYPISLFLPESWSPNSDNEQMFDERVPKDYDLYNLSYIVSTPDKFTPDKPAVQIGQYGPFYLYKMPTTGYFHVASSNIMVHADKDSFMNIVHVWQKSFVRDWNMVPLIDLENRPAPLPITQTIKMTDMNNYEFDGKQFNLFASFPFSFPQATVSGTIKNEAISQKETYSATVTVPANCKNCFTIFKMTYHPGWKAKLDGKDATIYAAFPFMMALQTPPGEHRVEFSYEPSGLKVLLLLGAIIITGAYIYRKYRAQK